MKKPSFHLFILLLFILTCCGEEEIATTANNSKKDDFYQFYSFDLTKFEIPASIMLPDETVGIGTSFVPEVKHNEADFLWEINIGPNFVFLIEDYGDMSDLVKTFKQKNLVSKNSVYKTKILVDEPELIIYERSIIDGSKDIKPTYHAYAQRKIKGVYYEFKTPDSGFSKKVIDYMEKTFRSVKEQKK